MHFVLRIGKKFLADVELQLRGSGLSLAQYNVFGHAEHRLFCQLVALDAEADPRLRVCPDQSGPGIAGGDLCRPAGDRGSDNNARGIGVAQPELCLYALYRYSFRGSRGSGQGLRRIEEADIIRAFANVPHIPRHRGDRRHPAPFRRPAQVVFRHGGRQLRDAARDLLQVRLRQGASVEQQEQPPL